MEYYLEWLNNNLLSVVAFCLTSVLIYHYLIERETGLKLSKKYRNSIFEAQSKIFLNATQYLISGNKNLAIREFLNAVDINRETIETYFALGGLFCSNGEIDKSISIHRSLIARNNISESVRLRALKELAIDFDKGGFIDKAIETYKDVLKINRDQSEVIHALCRIYEDIEDWDQAYNYRIMMSKVARENQSETISHILVQKAKDNFMKGDFSKCHEDLEDAFLFAPSVSAKILKLKLHILNNNIEDSRFMLLELVREHPMYASFVFSSLLEGYEVAFKFNSKYDEHLSTLRDYFISLDDIDLMTIPSFVLSKVMLLKEKNLIEEAYEILNKWLENNSVHSEVLESEFIKILISLGKKEEAINRVEQLLENFDKSLTRHFCKQCGYNSDDIFWRCPQCHEWETIQFRWKV